MDEGARSRCPHRVSGQLSEHGRSGFAAAERSHFIAGIGGEFVGNQSFYRSGERLICINGIFDKERHSNFHAYENIILESVRFAAEEGLKRIDYGPVVNPTKAKMMTHFAPVHLRYVSRLRPAREIVTWMHRRSPLLSPERLKEFIGLEPVLS